MLLTHDPDPGAVWQDVTDAPCPASRVAARSWLTYEEHPMGLMDSRCKVCGAPLGTAWFANPVSVNVIEELAQCMGCVDASTSLTPDVLCALRQFTDRQNERLLNAAQASDALEEERGV